MRKKYKFFKELKFNILFKKKYLFLFIFIFIVLILFLSGYSFGKSFFSTFISSSGKVANPIIIVDSSEKLNINNESKKGIYEFVVKNFDELGNVNEVNMEYQIELIFKDLSNKNSVSKFNIKVFKNDSEIKIVDNKSDQFFMNNSNPQEDRFKVIIDCSNLSAEEFMDSLQIKVHSNQVDKVL